MKGVWFISKRADKELVADILEAINRIFSYTSQMLSEDFWDDEKTQDAVVRNLEIIGEAAKNISETVKEKYSGIPWKSLGGVRNRLIHRYFGVNLDVVWSIVREELPNLAEQIKSINC